MAFCTAYQATDDHSADSKLCVDDGKQLLLASRVIAPLLVQHVSETKLQSPVRVCYFVAKGNYEVLPLKQHDDVPRKE